MKPSFALSLSFDGIRLLHRAAGGWRVVGDVALDADDMAAELEVLRKTASALEPGGLHTKVLLPDEQIKYLTIDTPGADDAARRAAALIALDGATPYAVDDLAFDISVDGDKTHIAAVAHETLAEAEGFAHEHRFQPVSFAAIPGDHAYLGEPFFGATAVSATFLENGEEVEPDGIAVVVVGDIKTPSGPVVELDDPDVNDAEAVVDVAPVDTAETGSPDPETPQTAISDTPVVEIAGDSAEVGETLEDADRKPPAIDAAAPEVAPVAAAPMLGPAPAPESAPRSPTVGFASRRAPEKTTVPQLEGVKRNAVASTMRPQQGAVTSGELDIEPDAVVPETPTPSKAPTKSGFLSRRKSKPDIIPSAPPPLAEQEGTEKERMTVFGARKGNVGGKPRYLGLILTAALLVFLAGVAAWASVFLDDGISLSRLFGERGPTTAEVLADEQEEDATPDVKVATLDPTLTPEDAAVLDALSDPVQPGPQTMPSDAQLEAIYAATGIWPRAPEVPPEPAGLVNIEDLYLTSIDPVSTTTDAVALPDVSGFATDITLSNVSSPAAAGTLFALDSRGLVIPTVQGALSPDGFTVFLGSPPRVPPETPTRSQAEPEDTAIQSALAAFRPRTRPADLEEKTERAQLDGLTRNELAGYRPALRPKSLQQQAEAASVPAPEPEAEPEQVNTDSAVALALANTAQPVPALENATKFAVRASVRPDVRPRNFARIVKRAQRAKPDEEVRVASAATVAPRVVKPKVPTKASVAKQATVKNAINLRKVNLIGVYGKPSNRRALVRLGNGRYKKVVVGDRIDGGRVSAIGEGELRYVKRGKNVVLKMPR